MSSLTLYYKEARYDLISIMRTPSFVLPALVFPLMFYLLFGVFFNSGNASDYLLVTYSCFGIMGPALFNFAAGIASDRAHGWLTLKQLSPMPVSAYLIAKLSTSLVFSAVILLLLFSVGILFGNVALQPWQWLLLAIIMLIGTVPFALLGLLLGLSLSDKAAPGVVNLLYLPMAFLSGLWLPLFLLPLWLQKLAWIWPSFHLSQLGLKVIAQDQGANVFYHLSILVATTLLLAFVAARCFRKL
ncbi:ABC transporter permease [Rheinheimera sp. MMS21-TC3]|uniref:ABC transporter permease n=1 Tax=Rheinheimera sp. MMS21-TC3 TaxID=3072790 RepID=UPI0028C485DC|nr:ABC transporter permease [Rheinheimera sp. MMS21-TC3]WNO59614.1 ABC transporter permease [Rheinheimera sp. MMS21-TC3]